MNKNNKKKSWKREKLIAIGSIAIVSSFGSLSYSSYILYISSRTIYIKNKAIGISDFINLNIDKWNQLCLLVSNNIDSISNATGFYICNDNNSYIYICYKYQGNQFKFNWNNYINKYNNLDLNELNTQLIYDLKYNKLFENSNIKDFSNNLSYLIDNMSFHKVNDLYAFILSLIFDITATILITISIIYIIKNKEYIKSIIKSK